MHDPVAIRFLGVPGTAVLWVLTAVSFLLFGGRVYGILVSLRKARPESRWDRLAERARLFARNVLLGERLLEERAIGVAHLLIFWCFVLYAACFFWNLARGLLPFLPVPYADGVPLVGLLLEVVTAGALAGLAVAAVRRYVFTPARLERSRDATRILCLISLLLVSFLVAQGARSLAGEGSALWMPAGTAAGALLAAVGVPPSAAETLYIAAFWVHMVTVLGFMAYLPYSKHLHLLASPFGVFFADLRPAPVPAASEGASRLAEFTWRQVLGSISCAECGRCDRSCPAQLGGSPLSPQRMLHHVKDLLRAGDGAPVQATPEEVWGCMACYSCAARCPVFNEHVPVIVELRRRLVAEGSMDAPLQDALQSLARYGNSFGVSDRARAKWTQGLPFKVKDARKEPVEYLWVVGDYASYHPRAQEATRATARVLHEGGVDFGILYEGERNSGNDVRRAGEEGLFEVLREKNLAMLGKAKFDRILTTDPHTYHALRNEYGLHGAGKPNGKVVHSSVLLADLVASGRIPVREKPGEPVTYHDPCYLGRCNGVTGPPRELIRALGADLREMPRNRDRSFCCGAGGGRIWMEDAPGTRERPAEARVREAASLAGVATLVTSCPKDLVMFADAVKTAGLEGRIVIRDTAELCELAMAPRKEAPRA